MTETGMLLDCRFSVVNLYEKLENNRRCRNACHRSLNTCLCAEREVPPPAHRAETDSQLRRKSKMQGLPQERLRQVARVSSRPGDGRSK